MYLSVNGVPFCDIPFDAGLWNAAKPRDLDLVCGYANQAAAEPAIAYIKSIHPDWTVELIDDYCPAYAREQAAEADRQYYDE